LTKENPRPSSSRNSSRLSMRTDSRSVSKTCWFLGMSTNSKTYGSLKGLMVASVSASARPPRPQRTARARSDPEAPSSAAASCVCSSRS
jgi:hypothetical protein